MLKTRITDMFGIRYPVIQGAMARVSSPRLVAAVSNAGGLGVLVSAGCGSKEALREEIRKTKALTDRPFGVNISLFPLKGPTPRDEHNEEYVEVIAEEKLAMVETSGFEAPGEFIKPLHDAGVKVMHKCTAVRHAQTAEKIGVDAVAMVGFENGGARGRDDVTTMLIVPLTVDGVKIPVLAGGGIGDSRGFVAALALGAEGVVVGTRFLATHESGLHPNVMDWMIRTTERDITAQRSMRSTQSGGRQRSDAMFDGNLDGWGGLSGQAVGLICKVTSVKEVIDEMASGVEEFQKRLGRVLA